MTIDQDLFADLGPEQLSPFAQWRRDNGVETFPPNGLPPEFQDDPDADEWLAVYRDEDAERDYRATGLDEEEACWNLCRKAGIESWHDLGGWKGVE